MGKVILTVVVLLNVGYASGQYDSVEVRDMVQNTIVSYHIAKLIEEGIEVKNDEFLSSELFKGDWINMLMQAQKSILDFDLKQSSNFNFPDTNYVIYEVVKKGMGFSDSAGGKDVLIPLPHNYFPYDTHYLLAVNKYEDGIIFISGSFFKTNFSSYFPPKMKQEEFIKYAHLKLYFLNIDKVNKLKESIKCWRVTCTLTSGEKIVAKFSKNDLDIFTLKH